MDEAPNHSDKPQSVLPQQEERRPVKQYDFGDQQESEIQEEPPRKLRNYKNQEPQQYFDNRNQQGYHQKRGKYAMNKNSYNKSGNRDSGRRGQKFKEEPQSSDHYREPYKEVHRPPVPIDYQKRYIYQNDPDSSQCIEGEYLPSYRRQTQAANQNFKNQQRSQVNRCFQQNYISGSDDEVEVMQHQQPQYHYNVQSSYPSQGQEKNFAYMQINHRSSNLQQLVEHYNSQGHLQAGRSASEYLFPFPNQPEELDTSELFHLHKQNDFVEYRSYVFRTKFFRLSQYDDLSLVRQKFKCLAHVNLNHYARSDDAFVMIRPNPGMNNVHKAIKYGIWTSGPDNNERIQDLYSRFPSVYLIFLPRVPKNKRPELVGIARVKSNYQREKHFLYWDKEANFLGIFELDWIYVKTIPADCLPDFQEMHDGRSVRYHITEVNDGYQLFFEEADQIFGLFRKAPNRPSYFDNFIALDQLEDELRYSRQKDQMRSAFPKKQEAWRQLNQNAAEQRPAFFKANPY